MESFPAHRAPRGAKQKQAQPGGGCIECGNLPLTEGVLLRHGNLLAALGAQR
jgi:hypothetical protein